MGESDSEVESEDEDDEEAAAAPCRVGICNMWSLDIYCIYYSWRPRVGKVVYTYILHTIYRTYRHKRIQTYECRSMILCTLYSIHNASEGGPVERRDQQRARWPRSKYGSPACGEVDVCTALSLSLRES